MPSPCALALAAQRASGSRRTTRLDRAHAVLELRRRIDAHPERSDSLGELAQSVGLSQAHLTRLFKELTGAPPIAYRQRRRLEKAQELLAKGSPVWKAAIIVGYRSAPTFARLFAREFGHPPKSRRIG